MKGNDLPSGWWNRYLLAFTGGLMLGLSFPKIGWFWLAWLGHGLILLAAFGQRPGAAFRVGWFAGIAQFFIPFYWLLFIPFPGHAVAAWCLVGGLLSCYTALWTCLCSWLFPAKVLPQSDDSISFQAARALDALSAKQKILWPLACALCWVSIEMLIIRLFNGLPYSLGVSQFKVLPLIQIASVTGVYGVSFVMVWVSVVVSLIGLRLYLKRRLPAGWIAETIWPVAALAAILAFGWLRLAQPGPSGREIRIALIQPSIPQRLIWEASEKTNRFQKLIRLSEQAMAFKPDLLVWPEAAMPNFFTRFNPAVHQALLQLSESHPAWIILGATDARSRSGTLPAPSSNDLEVFNSSFLIHPSGQLVAKYHKRKLVMFGEYMPLSRWFPLLNRFRSLDGGYTPGREAVPFLLTNLNTKIAVLICAEDTYPHLVQETVDEETDFLLNLTNNGWFGEGAAQWQHAVDALFRAVEQGLPMVRCANNGLTCWMDSHGRIRAIHFPGSRNIYQEGFKIVQLPLRNPGQKRRLTFYARCGDWFGWTCVTLSVGLGLLRLPGRKDRRYREFFDSLCASRTLLGPAICLGSRWM